MHTGWQQWENHATMLRINANQEQDKHQYVDMIRCEWYLMNGARH